MNSPEIKQFINQHSNLFWYTPEDKKKEISNEVLVETILNYGDKDAVIQLIHLMGVNKVADLFFNSINLSDRRKGNYHEITINYFTHVFRKYDTGIFSIGQIELLPYIQGFQRDYSASLCVKI